MFTLPGKSVFSPSKPKVKAAPAPPPPPPEPDDPEVQDAGKAEAELRRRRGSAKSILAGKSLTEEDTSASISQQKLGNS